MLNVAGESWARPSTYYTLYKVNHKFASTMAISHETFSLFSGSNTQKTQRICMHNWTFSHTFNLANATLAWEDAPATIENVCCSSPSVFSCFIYALNSACHRYLRARSPVPPRSKIPVWSCEAWQICRLCHNMVTKGNITSCLDQIMFGDNLQKIYGAVVVTSSCQ